jgi:hypothetical protein
MESTEVHREVQSGVTRDLGLVVVGQVKMGRHAVGIDSASRVAKRINSIRREGRAGEEIEGGVGIFGIPSIGSVVEDSANEVDNHGIMKVMIHWLEIVLNRRGQVGGIVDDRVGRKKDGRRCDNGSRGGNR